MLFMVALVNDMTTIGSSLHKQSLWITVKHCSQWPRLMVERGINTLLIINDHPSMLVKTETWDLTVIHCEQKTIPSLVTRGWCRKLKPMTTNQHSHPTECQPRWGIPTWSSKRSWRWAVPRIGFRSPAWFWRHESSRNHSLVSDDSAQFWCTTRSLLATEFTSQWFFVWWWSATPGCDPCISGSPTSRRSTRHQASNVWRRPCWIQRRLPPMVDSWWTYGEWCMANGVLANDHQSLLITHWLVIVILQ